MAEAVLFVELVPTTAGIKRQVEKDLSGSFTEVESRGTSMLSKIGGGVRGVATAVSATIATVAGMSLTGGISRLLNIEDAQAKLRGLGHDAASVDQIMTDALNSVRGTSFGLDSAATVAASAVASGIKPGQELERYLRLTADAATIAGVSLDEMGSVLNKVTASGKVSADNINQLQERSIPILQWLADEYGVTAEAMSKMVSDGKVDAETFRKVIEDNIGGAALSSGDTTRGAFANMLTSISRIGAQLLSGVFPVFKEVFQGITALLGPIEDKAGAIGQVIGERLTPFIDGLMSAVSGGLPDLSGLLGILGPLAGAFALLGAGGLGGLIAQIPLIGGLAGPLAALGGPIGVVAGAIAGLVAVSPALQNALGGAFSTLGSVLSGVFEQIAPTLSALLPMLSSLAQVIGSVLASAITTVVPFVAEILTLFGNLAAQLLPMLLPLIGSLIGFVAQLAAALLPVVSTLLDALLPVFNALIPIITSVIAAVMPLVASLVSALAPILVTVAELLGTLLSPILAIVAELILALTPVIQVLVEQAVNILTGALTFLIPVIQGVVNAIGSVMIPIIDTLRNVLSSIGDFIKNVFAGNWEAAWNSIGDIFENVWNGFMDVGRGAINSIIDLVNGMIGGINDAAGFISDVTGGAVTMQIPKIPKLAAGATVLPRPGGTLAILAEAGRAESVVDTGLVNAALLDGIRGARESGGGGNYTFEVYPQTQDGRLFVRQMADEVRRHM